MHPADRIYAFDIETDTDGVNGLDPRESRITEIAVSTAKEDVVFDAADEGTLISDFNSYLVGLPPGLLTGWNSSFFDLPFIWSRWMGVDGAGQSFTDRPPYLATPHDDLGMYPVTAPGLTPKYGMLPGYTTALGCTWRASAPLSLDVTRRPVLPRPVHQHLDVSFAYKRVAEERGLKWSLKPVCQALGISMIEVDRERMHELTPAQRAAYACSDTRGTRELAIRLLGAE